MAFELSPERKAVLDDLLPKYPTKKALTIPLLHLCQEQEGWCSPDVVSFVAKQLDVSTAHVQGVVTFYTSFLQKKTAKHNVWVCRTLSCELAGAKQIQSHLEKRLGCHAGESTTDGEFALHKAECLAGCGQGPVVQIDDEYFENLSVEKIDRILDDARKKGLPGDAKIGFSPVGVKRGS